MLKLSGKVAVVAGASRGAGRGIACALGEAGATVYVTGRSSQRSAIAQRYPETIEETAELVRQCGGVGIPVQVDHTVDAQVAALFERVQQEHDRLDVLVTSVWGGYETFDRFRAPFWNQPLERWESMFTAGVRARLVTCHFAVPLMLPRRQGLIVNITTGDGYHYLANIYYDLAKQAFDRMVYGMAIELREYNIAAVALSPAWIRTERLLREFNTDEQHWREIDVLEGTESARYVGRAVVALATDPNVMHKSGRVLKVGDLAREYDFTDIDGRQLPAAAMPAEDLRD